MTYTTSEVILAAQKATAYEPSLLLTIQDNNLPHSLLLFDLVGQDNEPTAGCSQPGVFIIRARHNTGVGVEWQRITNPDTQSEWESWTLWDAAGGYPAVFVSGSYIVFAWQDLGTNAVKWKRSSDNGLTWSSEQTIWTPAYTLDHFQQGVAGNGGLFYVSGSVLYFRLYDRSGDSWGSELSYDFGAPIIGLGACEEDGDYRLAVSLTDYNSYSTRSLVLCNWDSGGMDTVEQYFDLHGLSGEAYDIRWPSLRWISGSSTTWLSFSLAGDTAAGAFFGSTQVLASSRQGRIRFTSPVWLNRNQADRLIHLEWAGGVVYSAAYSVVYKSSPVATVTANTSQIIRYTSEGGIESRLSITLDNRDGAFDGLETGRLGLDMFFARGPLIDGVNLFVQRELFIIDGFEWSQDEQRVTVTGFNRVGLLRRWRAEYAFYRSNITLGDACRMVVGLAGCGIVEDDMADRLEIVPQFVIQSGQSAMEALQALQNQYQFWLRPTIEGGIEFFDIEAAPTPDYVFGQAAGEHPTLFAVDTARRRLPSHTHAMVFASGAGGEAINLDLQAEMGRQLTRFIRRKYVSDAAAALGIADSSVEGALQGMSLSRLVCLPAFQLQAFDVVQSDDWQDDQVRYISAIREVYDTEKYQYSKYRMPWYQEIDLGGVDLFFRGYGAAGFAFESLPGPEGPRELRRANLVSFDSATWTALVQVEDSPSAVSMPVGQWVPSPILTAGATLAVLLFDESNPNDGVIIGPYGAASPAFDDYYAPVPSGTTGQFLTNDGSGWTAAAPVIDPTTGSIVIDPTTGSIVVER